ADRPRVEELAEMLAGSERTDTTLQQAGELITAAANDDHTPADPASANAPDTSTSKTKSKGRPKAGRAGSKSSARPTRSR
ncbi:MAG: hypothetical protein GVY24_02905, partial [Planctomycetes bacterium]|nr:hypothetical protein [Planctomycetota bacterium]